MSRVGRCNLILGVSLILVTAHSLSLAGVLVQNDNIKKYVSSQYQKLIIIKFLQKNKVIKTEYDLGTKKIINTKEYDPEEIMISGLVMRFADKIDIYLFGEFIGWAGGGARNPLSQNDLSINLPDHNEFRCAGYDVKFTKGSAFSLGKEKIKLPQSDKLLEIYRFFTVNKNGIVLVPFALLVDGDLGNTLFFGTDIENNVIEWGIDFNNKVIKLPLDVPAASLPFCY